MKGMNDRRSQTAEEARPSSARVVPSDAKKNAPAGPAPTEAKDGVPPSHLLRNWLLSGGGRGWPVRSADTSWRPWVLTALNTVSTDDAYVNGHVTFVAPRVAGQVSQVLVDDNYYVKKGDVLVELDSEPYRVQVAIKKAAVEAAETRPGGRPGPSARPSGPGPGQSLQARTRHRGRG